jgi:hypothetical protein
MSDLTDQEALAAQFLTDNKWKLASDDNFAPGEDFRIIKRRMDDLPWENLDAALQYLAGLASFATPVIEGKTYTGTWYQGHVWWEKSQRRADDTSITLYQLLVCGAGGSFVFTTPTQGGPVVTTVCYDMTKAAADALLVALLNTKNNSSGFSWNRETNRWSGSITTRDVVGAIASWWDRQGVIEYRKHEYIDKDGYGQRWLYVDKVTSNFRAGAGIQFGLAAYAGGLQQDDGASSWMQQSYEKDTWYFKRVVKVERKIYFLGGMSGGTGLYTLAAPVQVPVGGDWIVMWPTSDIVVKTPWGDS